MTLQVAGIDEIVWHAVIRYLQITIIVVDVIISGGGHLFDNL